jgi:hypothetical protein
MLSLWIDLKINPFGRLRGFVAGENKAENVPSFGGRGNWRTTAMKKLRQGLGQGLDPFAMPDRGRNPAVNPVLVATQNPF